MVNDMMTLTPRENQPIQDAFVTEAIIMRIEKAVEEVLGTHRMNQEALDTWLNWSGTMPLAEAIALTVFRSNTRSMIDASGRIEAVYAGANPPGYNRWPGSPSLTQFVDHVALAMRTDIMSYIKEVSLKDDDADEDLDPEEIEVFTKGKPTPPARLGIRLAEDTMAAIAKTPTARVLALLFEAHYNLHAKLSADGLMVQAKDQLDQANHALYAALGESGDGDQ
ncbi:hypothetical protein [Burkholderia phage BCSR5]|nr:hypothetical protein [Burkholderia phage BCSR5]